MKNSKRVIFILLVLVIVAFLPLNAFSKGKPVELRLAHMFPVGATSHKHIEQWANKIATDSNGRLTIRIFPVGTLIAAPPEIYSGVAKGVADLGLTFRYKPEGYGIGVTFPFIMGAPDTVTATRIYDDLWKKFPKQMGEEWKEVKILYLTASMPQYLIARKTLRRLEDIKGLQIRVPSREMGDLIKELGATPVYMSTPDFMIGIEKGTVDGAVLIFEAIPDNKLGGRIKYVVTHSLGVPTPVGVFMNKDSFNSLPADLQKVIENSCEWGKEDMLRYWSAGYENAKKYCQAEGIELISLSPEERTKFNTIIERTRDKVGADLDAKGYPGTEIVRFIRERAEHYAR
jgi:TRAP-type C4-dicarboxylate transport system substrate-binding protein